MVIKYWCLIISDIAEYLDLLNDYQWIQAYAVELGENITIFRSGPLHM